LAAEDVSSTAEAPGVRDRVRAVLVQQAPVVAGLWGLAVAQPLLDIFGSTPAYFVVNRLSTTEIVLFALAIVTIGPVLLVALEAAAAAVHERAGAVLHLVIVGLLGAAVVLRGLRQLDLTDSVSVLLGAALGGGALAYLYLVSAPVRSGLRYLGLAPILFLLVFVAWSPTAEVLRGEPAATASGATVGAPAPVVILSLDEFPTASLLRVDGSINAERFPEFARLAATATWYRNATSVAARTEQSVPALFTGLLPEPGALPTAGDHPRSIFTLLGESYDLEVLEQITAVCPTSLCPLEDQAASDHGLSTAVADAAVVYGHAVLPPDLRADLPAVEGSWGDFLGQEAEATAAWSQGEGAATQFTDPAGAARPPGPDPTCPRTRLWCGSATISELIDRIEPGGRPGLYVTHATFPHSPWTRSPEGHQYAAPATTPGVEGDDLTWVEDPAFAREGLQRHLWAVGYADALVGELRVALEDAGLWEDAVVVVVADHGIAFEPGLPARTPTPETQADIYGIPLFIKAPGQQQGVVTDANALNVDVLPTIVDLLEIDVGWSFDGESLVAGRPHRADKPVLVDEGWTSIPGGLDALVETVVRHEQVLPYGEDWNGVVAFGPHGDLVGRPVEEMAVEGRSPLRVTVDESPALADWRPGSTTFAPLLVHGVIDHGGQPPPAEVLAVLNGRVAGVVVLGTTVGDDAVAYTALLATEALRHDGNEVSFLVPTSPEARTFAELLVSP